MDKFVLIRPDDPNPVDDPGSCGGCNKKASWEKSENGGFMGKELWLTTLQNGLCEKCSKVLTENKKKADEEQRKKNSEDAKFRHLSRILGGDVQARDFIWEKLNPKLNENLYRFMRSFNPKNQNLYLHGINGLGKTMLSTAVLREAHDSGKRVLALNMRDLNRKLREAAMDGEEFNYIKRITDVDVLFLDDIGIGKLNDFRIDSFCAILENWHYADKRGLMLASNLTLNSIAETFSDRIASRIRGMCKDPYGQVVVGQGEDLRLRVVG